MAEDPYGGTPLGGLSFYENMPFTADTQGSQYEYADFTLPSQSQVGMLSCT